MQVKKVELGVVDPINDFDEVVYISHPFQNKKSNVEKIQNIVRQLTIKYPRSLFICPVLTFGFLYNEVSYEKGLAMAMRQLVDCDRMIVYGDWEHSQGCKEEIRYCQTHNIPYKIEIKYPFDYDLNNVNQCTLY